MTTPPVPRDPTAVRRERAAVLLLLGVCAAWGSTFVLVKDLTDAVPVPDVLAVRFAMATAALCAIAPRAVRSLSPAAIRHGLILGALYGTAQILQTTGLTTITASVSGFVTGTYVVFTPVLAARLLGHRVDRATWAAVAMATPGIAALSLRGFAMGTGELLTLASAALYAGHIVGLGRWTTAEDAMGLTIVQMASVTVICTVFALPGGIDLPHTPMQWLSLTHMALVAGAAAMLAQTWAQAHMSPTKAAIVFTAEPVFATLFGVAFHQDPITLRFVLGAGLVVGSMLLAELGPRHSADATVARLPGE